MNEHGFRNGVICHRHATLPAQVKTRLHLLKPAFRLFVEQGKVLFRIFGIVSLRSGSLLPVNVLHGRVVLYLAVGLCHVFILAAYLVGAELRLRQFRVQVLRGLHAGRLLRQLHVEDIEDEVAGTQQQGVKDGREHVFRRTPVNPACKFFQGHCSLFL